MEGLKEPVLCDLELAVLLVAGNIGDDAIVG